MSKLTWKKTAALVMTVTMLMTAAAGCWWQRVLQRISLRRAALLPQLKAARAPQRKAARRAQPRRKTDEMAVRMLRISSTQSMCRKRNDNTDEECKAAKEAWDALTDAQKELVEGDNADPYHFGRRCGQTPRKTTLRNERPNRRKRAARCQLRYVLQRQSRKGYQGH